MRRNRLSAFQPADRDSFIVFDGKEPRKVKPKKKRWLQAVKMNAVRKCQMYGLSKAVKMLIEENPEQYKDLTPSTLQYWVHILSPEVSSASGNNSEYSSQL